MRRRRAAGQLARQVDAAVAERGVTGQLVEGAAGVMDLKTAAQVEVHGRSRSKLGAMDAGCAQPGRHISRFASAIYMHFAGQVTTPAGVGADGKAHELTELGLAPFHVDMHGHETKLRGAVKLGFQAHQTGVGQVEADVGAGRLAAQADAPFAGLFLPEREIGFDQREGQLLGSILEIDAGIGRFHVRQRQGAGSLCGCSGAWLGRGVGSGGAEERIEVPAAFRGADHVEAGFIDADAADLHLAAPERKQTDGRGDRVGMEDRLGAVRRVLLHGQV